MPVVSEQKRRTLSKSSDYLDTLATTLRDLGGATTIPHELTQNADDSGNATTIRFTVTDDALTVWNDGTFTDCGDDGGKCPRPKRCDLHAFRQFAGRTKAGDALQLELWRSVSPRSTRSRMFLSFCTAMSTGFLTKLPMSTNVSDHATGSVAEFMVGQEQHSFCRGPASPAHFGRNSKSRR